MDAFISHWFTLDDQSKQWIGHCASGCRTWFLVQPGAGKNPMRIVFDGPTCQKCYPAEDTQPDNKISVEPQQKPFLRKTQANESPPTANDNPAPSLLGKRSDRSYGEIRNETIHRQEDTDSSRPAVNLRYYVDGNEVVPLPLTEKPAAAPAKSVPDHVKAVLSKIDEQLRRSETGDTQLAEAACQILADIADFLDRLRNWLGEAAGRTVKVAVKWVGAPEPVADLLGKAISAAVTGRLLAPLRTMANALRLTGMAICASEGRPITHCRCAADLTVTMLKQAAFAEVTGIIVDPIKSLLANNLPSVPTITPGQPAAQTGSGLPAPGAEKADVPAHQHYEDAIGEFEDIGIASVRSETPRGVTTGPVVAAIDEASAANYMTRPEPEPRATRMLGPDTGVGTFG